MRLAALFIFCEIISWLFCIVGYLEENQELAEEIKKLEKEYDEIVKQAKECEEIRRMKYDF